MKWFHRTTSRPNDAADADRAYEISQHEFASAVHQAKKNNEAANRVQRERLINHIGPSVAAEIGRMR